MIDPKIRKDCPMRGHLGNCYPIGGFCMDAVSDEICEALHNAYAHGFCNAMRTLKEQYSCENCDIAIEDRQPIVRCKDCKHRPTYWCELHSDWKQDDWYCADGERQ